MLTIKKWWIKQLDKAKKSKAVTQSEVAQSPAEISRQRIYNNGTEQFRRNLKEAIEKCEATGSRESWLVTKKGHWEKVVYEFRKDGYRIYVSNLDWVKVIF